MTPYWYLWALLGCFILFALCIAIEIAWAYWKDRQRWKAVAPYYGRPYHASGEYRPNVDLRRTR